jgi:hypothetical protein
VLPLDERSHRPVNWERVRAPGRLPSFLRPPFAVRNHAHAQDYDPCAVIDAKIAEKAPARLNYKRRRKYEVWAQLKWNQPIHGIRRRV